MAQGKGKIKKYMIGKVENYSPRKGYGFIMGDDGKRYYVSSGNIDKNNIRSGQLASGYTVSFNTGKAGNKAYDVRYL